MPFEWPYFFSLLSPCLTIPEGSGPCTAGSPDDLWVTAFEKLLGTHQASGTPASPLWLSWANYRSWLCYAQTFVESVPAATVLQWERFWHSTAGAHPGVFTWKLWTVASIGRCLREGLGEARRTGEQEGLDRALGDRGQGYPEYESLSHFSSV